MSFLREQRREETRRRLYEAALAHFHHDGVANCRIDDIARSAGVSRASFYFHYPTKDDVLLEYMRETELVITSAVDALPKDAPLCTVLETMSAALAGVWQPDPRLLPDVVAVGLRFTATVLTDPSSGRLRQTMAARFAAAAERGELTTVLPTGTLSDLYLGHTVAGMLAWYGHQETPLNVVLHSMNILFFGGVQPGVTKAAVKKRPSVRGKTAAKKRP
jgi:AcrR family transcriptional regulator